MPDTPDFDPGPYLDRLSHPEPLPDLSPAQVRRLGDRRQSRRRIGVIAGTLAFALVAGAAAYGLTRASEVPDLAATPSPLTTAQPSTTPTATPSLTTVPSTPVQTSSALLTAADLTWARGLRWPQGADLPAGSALPQVPCQSAPWSSLGAVGSLARTFSIDASGDVPAGKASAVLLQFRSDAEGARAGAIIASWAAGCHHPKQTDPNPPFLLPTSAGTAVWYVVSTTNAVSDNAWDIRAVGLATVGPMLQVVTIEYTVGQFDWLFGYDASYSEEPHPMRTALPRVVDRMAGRTPTPATATVVSPSASEVTPAKEAMTAAQVATVTDFAWAPGQTFVETAAFSGSGQAAQSACQKDAWSALGARRLFVREVELKGGGVFGFAVAMEFQSPAAAKAAASTLDAWFKGCGATMTANRLPQAGLAQTLPVAGMPAGSAGTWYLVTHQSLENSEHGVFHELGLVVSGSRVEVLGLRSQGMDYNWTSNPKEAPALLLYPLLRTMPLAATRLAS